MFKLLMYLVVTYQGCTCMTLEGVYWAAGSITVAKVQNLFECDLVPNYLQGFGTEVPIY